MATKKNPPPKAVGQAGYSDKRKTDSSKRLSKIHCVLRALASGRSINCFEAERELHDHCIQVYRETETVPSFQGALASVRRCRLLLAGQGRTQVLLVTLSGQGAR